MYTIKIYVVVYFELETYMAIVEVYLENSNDIVILINELGTKIVLTIYYLFRNSKLKN